MRLRDPTAQTVVYTRLELTEDEQLRPMLAELLATIAATARRNKPDREHTASCDVVRSRKTLWADLR